MGIYIIAEFRGVNPRKISRVEDLRVVLDRIVAKSGLHVISSSFHQFEPHGVSAIYLLSESHLSVHTWPKYGYMVLDIFTCEGDGPALKAFKLLLEEFQPKSVKKCLLGGMFLGKLEARILYELCCFETNLLAIPVSCLQSFPAEIPLNRHTFVQFQQTERVFG